MGPLRPTPRPVTRINRLTLLVGVGLLLAIVAGLAYLKTKMHLPTWSTAVEDAPATIAKLPEVLTKPAPTYQAPAPPPPRELPPLASPLLRTPAPVVKPWPEPVPTPAKPIPTQQAVTLPDFLQPRQEEQRKAPLVPAPAQPPHDAGQPPPKDAHKWLFADVKRPASSHQTPAQPDLSKNGLEKQTLEKHGQAANLIRPAIWARPQRPDLTIFRSQILPCRTTQALNTDIPGTVVTELTVPIFGNKGTGQELLPKASKIIAKQAGKAEYGQSRIPLTLEQIEIPGPRGIVVSLKANVGDSEGAQGLPASVNNHWGKLVGAVAINAVLQLGIGSATGTPQGFYQSPTQRAGQDAGEAMARDINGVAQRQLRVPPTLEVPAGALCSISLEENVTFSREPVVVR